MAESVENYFFELEDFEGNKLSEKTGEFEIYCCEKAVATTSSSSIVALQGFTTDEMKCPLCGCL
jgi:hypothetical protein